MSKMMSCQSNMTRSCSVIKFTQIPETAGGSRTGTYCQSVAPSLDLGKKTDGHLLSFFRKLTDRKKKTHPVELILCD